MTDKPLPGHDKQPDEIICSSCGRFVGALTRCPHCGASVHKRMSVRVTRHAALVLGVVGLILLYLMATHKELTVVKIGDIKPTMNFAAVRIIGTVSSDARIFRQAGRVKSIRFDVDDGTGEIPVAAYQAQARGLMDQKKIPRMGDHVQVSGSLSIAADERILMRLQGPSQLVLERTELDVTPLGRLTLENSGESVLVEASIVNVRAPREGSKSPWSILLADDTGQLPLSFWDGTYTEITDKAALSKGAMVRVRASVASYRDKLQLKLAHGEDLRVIGRGAAPKAKPKRTRQNAFVNTPIMIEEITVEMKGKRVETEGVVAEVSIPQEGTKAPHKITLQDGDAKIAVIYWDKLAKQMGVLPEKGTRVRVRGTVDEYKGQLQLKINFADQWMPVDADKGTPASEASIPIASIDASSVGQIVSVSGKLDEPKSIRGGVIYPLQSGDKRIQILIWDKEISGEERDALEAGVDVTIKGEVKEYKGTLQVVPRDRGDIQVHTAAGGRG